MQQLKKKKKEKKKHNIRIPERFPRAGSRVFSVGLCDFFFPPRVTFSQLQALRFPQLAAPRGDTQHSPRLQLGGKRSEMSENK